MPSYSHWGLIDPQPYDFVAPKTFITSALAAEMADSADAYTKARAEHAFLLRCEGLTYREIGSRFGVSEWRANQLVDRFSRRIGRAMRKAKISINTTN